jgi:DNA-binding NarL/FixJ family response regulator
MGCIRVLIADDHPGVLSALVSVLEVDPRFAVVGTASTGAEACHLAGEGRLDLVLLDVHMPGGGAAAAKAMTALRQPPIVVAISAESGSGVVEEMLRAGAVGYLTKGRIGDMLPDLLIRCAEGEVILATPAGVSALRAVLRSNGDDPAEREGRVTQT